MNDANNSPKVIRHLLHKGAKFDFERLEVESTRPGETLSREIVRHPGAVVILPILEGSGGPPRVVLIRNWRISLERWVYELPAGTLEQGEQPADCAARELEEETGYAAGDIRPLAAFYTSPGLSDEAMHAYIARQLTPVGQRLEVDERVTVHPVPVVEAFAMIDSGELRDAKSMLCLEMARRRNLV